MQGIPLIFMGVVDFEAFKRSVPTNTLFLWPCVFFKLFHLSIVKFIVLNTSFSNITILKYPVLSLAVWI